MWQDIKGVDLLAIKSLMVKNGETQEDLAKAFNVTRECINRKLKGTRSFSIEDLIFIANRYHTDVEYFFYK